MLPTSGVPRTALLCLLLVAGLGAVACRVAPRPDAGPWVLATGRLGPTPSLPEAVTPSDWLVLEAVDDRGRRPLRPDAVYAAHLLSRESAAPVEGGELVGERGQARAWVRRELDEQGRLGRAAWAYSRLDLPSDGVLV
ncbi:MAG: hypothetical protein DRQ55_11820, partial [Planctomycetota bacterium]